MLLVKQAFSPQDVSRLKQTSLGWKPQVGVREAIGRCAAAYNKKNGKV